ncbi:uncharacterized protein LOC141605295 [Silene latifolia]|uniref:uncharacterized protein LOC141605295 n=1 Tax=Silene latifolia TaxID=37657 RepID=UPI003D78315C
MLKASPKIGKTRKSSRSKTPISKLKNTLVSETPMEECSEMAETKVSLKLLVDTHSKKVLFAEASKDFVDFLIHIMSLPVATIVKLLNANRMVGSLGALYKSIESLSSDYFEHNLPKDAILKPRAAINVPLLSLNEAPNTGTKKVYRCSSGSHFGYITDCSGTACPNRCGYTMSTEVSWVNSAAASVSTGDDVSDGGYVKGVVTYMVMDNLEVKPMSTISGITLINKFHVKDVASLTEKQVQLGLKEGLAMLKASLETNAVLTTVFIGK